MRTKPATSQATSSVKRDLGPEVAGGDLLLQVPAHRCASHIGRSLGTSPTTGRELLWAQQQGMEIPSYILSALKEAIALSAEREG